MFAVETQLTRLAVTTVDGTVTAIHLNAAGGTSPQSSFERMVARQLVEYMAGARRRFTFPIEAMGSPFDRAVWKALQSIPYGETRSYHDVAEAVGKPSGARAVGGSNHRNPIPLVIPCHRVVSADGSLGGFGGGVDLKRRLLELEGAIPRSLL
jgi:O-6-methylguanine DNA methyltransferase